MSLVTTLFADPAAGFYPHPGTLFVWVRAVIVLDIYLLLDKGRISTAYWILHVIRWRCEPKRHCCLVIHSLLPARVLTRKAQRGCEDGLSPLPGLHRPSRKGPTLPYVLHSVHDWQFRVAIQHEVAVHAMHVEILGNCLLRRRQALCYYSAAIDASRAGRMPQRASVCEEIWVNGIEMCQLQYIFNRSSVLGRWRWFD